MRNAYWITLPTLLMLTSLVSADEAVLAEEIAQSTQSKQNSMQMQNDQQPAETMPNFYEYHNRMAVFGPFHQVYERIQTDAFYVGVEEWLLPVFASNNRHGNISLIAEAELRMGYNYFYNGRDHVSPFVGVGFFKDLRSEHSNIWAVEDGVVTQHHHHTRPKPGIVYGTFGFLYDHEFNSIFTLGVNLKGIIGGPVSQKHFRWGSPVGGFDVAVPITFRFGPKRHWDIRIEPYDIYLHGSHATRNFVGFRSTVGYRF